MPFDGYGAVAPPLMLGPPADIGRRPVRLAIDGGWVVVVPDQPRGVLRHRLLLAVDGGIATTR